MLRLSPSRRSSRGGAHSPSHAQATGSQGFADHAHSQAAALPVLGCACLRQVEDNMQRALTRHRAPHRSALGFAMWPTCVVGAIGPRNSRRAPSCSVASVRRRMSNRESARRTRQRRSSELNTLRQENMELQAANKQLRADVAELTSVNNMLLNAMPRLTDPQRCAGWLRLLQAAQSLEHQPAHEESSSVPHLPPAVSLTTRCLLRPHRVGMNQPGSPCTQAAGTAGPATSLLT
jgi:hypothetical protein